MPYKDPEKAKAFRKAWYEANKERLYVLETARREANKERITARKKAWYGANKERLRAYANAWSRVNAARCGDSTMRRLLRVSGFRNEHITPELIDVRRLSLFINRELKQEQQQ